MKRLSFIPEIFIWLTFSVVAGFGYAFSFFEYVGNYTRVSMTDTIIPALVWMLLAAICTFLLKVAQNTQCFVKLSKSEALFLECSILALLLIGGWVFRFVDYFHVVWPTELQNEFFEFAQVGQNVPVYMNPHLASRLYVAFLHMVCLFLGNIYEAGAFVQFILLLLSVSVWYFTIRRIWNVTTALFFVAGAMLLPDSIVSSMQCTPMMLLFTIYGFVAWMIVDYVKGDFVGVWAFLEEIVLGIASIFAVFLDVSGILIAIAYIFAIIFRAQKLKKKNYFAVCSVTAGVLFGAGILISVQSYLYGISHYEAAFFHSYSEMSFVLPDLNSLKSFVFSLGTHPIMVVAIVVISIYWLLNKKQVFTWIMLAILYLFGIKLLKFDTYLQHDFMIYMAISVLLGVSVKQYLSLTDRQESVLASDDRQEIFDEESEPVVTVVDFDAEPQTVVPEKTLIFIPKTMEIPKRISKPKVDFALQVKEEDLHYDFAVEDSADYDIS